MLALLMLVQSTVGPPGDDPPPPAQPAHCTRADADQITVCARDPDAARLHKLPPATPATALPKAQVSKRLSAGTTVSADGETIQTKEGSFLRAMAHLEVAF